tara:strand:+ start:8234 stop:9253 length:1020 start_codon:yes stop_codon:yes gene_type:complete
MKIIVTGAAGFIGFHTCLALLKERHEILGVDNINAYYDVNLKFSRLSELKKLSELKNLNWHFIKVDLEDDNFINKIFKNFKPEIVIHLAAQAGVRYSIDNPKTYINSNLLGFSNIIENCRKFDINNFIYASSSSVYGGNKKLPFKEIDAVDHPVSLYAATKKSNEVVAHSYSYLYRIPSTGLRFFTVYGPWGRPDMAPMIFANSILKGIPIKVYNFGKMKRDFTYIEDVVEAVIRCAKKPATPNINFNQLKPEPSTSDAPHRIFNLGNSKPIKLLNFIEILENELGKKAIKKFLPMQLGDVKETASDTTALQEWIDFCPDTSLRSGIKKFATWFLDYYK